MTTPGINTHDYTKRGWGHDFTFTPINGGERGSMSGWGRGPREGDFLLLPNRGGSTRYLVESIRYCGDPTDMWFAEVVFAPRPEIERKRCDEDFRDNWNGRWYCNRERGHSGSHWNTDPEGVVYERVSVVNDEAKNTPAPPLFARGAKSLAAMVDSFRSRVDSFLFGDHWR